MRCLEKDPASRPQHAGELTATLDSVVARHSAQLAMPSSMLVPVVLGKALMLYVASVIAVLLLRAPPSCGSDSRTGCSRAR